MRRSKPPVWFTSRPRAGQSASRLIRSMRGRSKRATSSQSTTTAFRAGGRETVHQSSHGPVIFRPAVAGGDQEVLRHFEAGEPIPLQIPADVTGLLGESGDRAAPGRCVPRPGRRRHGLMISAALMIRSLESVRRSSRGSTSRRHRWTSRLATLRDGSRCRPFSRSELWGLEGIWIVSPALSRRPTDVHQTHEPPPSGARAVGPERRAVRGWPTPSPRISQFEIVGHAHRPRLIEDDPTTVRRPRTSSPAMSLTRFREDQGEDGHRPRRPCRVGKKTPSVEETLCWSISPCRSGRWR